MVQAVVGAVPFHIFFIFVFEGMFFRLRFYRQLSTLYIRFAQDISNEWLVSF
jgi:hypothetical protein